MIVLAFLLPLALYLIYDLLFSSQARSLSELKKINRITSPIPDAIKNKDVCAILQAHKELDSLKLKYHDDKRRMWVKLLRMVIFKHD